MVNIDFAMSNAFHARSKGLDTGFFVNKQKCIVLPSGCKHTHTTAKASLNIRANHQQQLWTCSRARMHQLLLRKQVLSQQIKKKISTATVGVDNTHHRKDNCLIHRITTPKIDVETQHLRAQLPACWQCKLIQ